MEAIGEMLKSIWDLTVEMLEALMEVLPKLISFVLWALTAVVVLPCVFVAGVIYPMWLEWGEDL